MIDDSWTERYVYSVRVRICRENAIVGDDGVEYCCGVSWNSRFSVSKNKPGSNVDAFSRKGLSVLTAALDKPPNPELGPAPTKKKNKRSSDQSDSLRELTQRLECSNSPRKPGAENNWESDTAANQEARAIIGSYVQRTIPFRSASFSQVDFSASDGKYSHNARGISCSSNYSPLHRSPRQKILPCVSYPCTSSTTHPLSPTTLQSSVAFPQGKHRRSLTHPSGTVASDERFPNAANKDYSLPDNGDRILIDGKSNADTSPEICQIPVPNSEPRLGVLIETNCNASYLPEKSAISDHSKNLLVEEAFTSNSDVASVGTTCHYDGQTSSVIAASNKGVGGSWNAREPGEWSSNEHDECQEETNKGKTNCLDVPRIISHSPKKTDSKANFLVLSPKDSLSEGEDENSEVSQKRTFQSFSPSDQSDNESKLTNTHQLRRYSKKPIRGPYGLMLEAEMKKPETIKHRDDLKFLEDLTQPKQKTSGWQRTMYDGHLHRSFTSPESTGSVKTRFNRNGSNSQSKEPEVHHLRTASSPSQLEGCGTEKGPKPTHELLAQLLKGSSEQSLSLVGSNSFSRLLCDPTTWKDTRTHVAVELYDTECSYVESLQILVVKYLHPLKCSESPLIDGATVDEIFFQIPEILAHHELFLDELKKRLENWNHNQKIGDVFLDTFTKRSVIETYTKFVNNWDNANEAIKKSRTKPAFARFLETLLKHTESGHGDISSLISAQQVIHELAMSINLGQHKSTIGFNSQDLSRYELIIEGLSGLNIPERTFLCHDRVSITTCQGRKERVLFLFSDILLITSIKRKSGTIRKLSQNVAGQELNTLEGNKFKLLLKIPLDDLTIIRDKDDAVRKKLKEMELLNADISTLTQMAELVAMLHCPHSHLEESVKEMLLAQKKQQTERHAADAQLSNLELSINTLNGCENIVIMFSKPEKRTVWEEIFNNAKQRLALIGEKRNIPELVSAVPIRKTRAGLQFTCAAPTYGPGIQDVWVCNSDGYVGQVCVLSLSPEPTVASCNGVCNARILCIAPIPGSQFSNEMSSCCYSGVGISVEDADKSATNIRLDSSSSSSDDDDREDEAQLIEDIVAGTMWLGTEDGFIHIYNCTDNIRTKKHKVKIQHSAPVQCIIYLENRVFVALGNGDIMVYFRESRGNWITNDESTVTVGSPITPVTKMTHINGRLWCSCNTTIKILNTSSLTIEDSFVVSAENGKGISAISASGFSVWISFHNSPTIQLFHATSYDLLGDINIAPAVSKILASSDDIIRQHKSACLRVTALLACKDLLWIGTSAGVVLTMPLPHITSSTTKLTGIPVVSGVPYGHTGQVRFLTMIDLVLPFSRFVDMKKKLPLTKNDNGTFLVISGGDGYEDFFSTGASEVAGKEDSTNHLLLWHV